MINHHMRAWGHTFLYDDQVLRNAFAEAGFAAITECSFGESTHPELRQIERHGASGATACSARSGSRPW